MIKNKLLCVLAFALISCSSNTASSDSTHSMDSITSSSSSLSTDEFFTFSYPIWQFYLDGLTLLWGDYEIPSYLTKQIAIEKIFLGDWITLNCRGTYWYRLEPVPMILQVADYQYVSIEQVKGRCVEVLVESGTPKIEEKGLSIYSNSSYADSEDGFQYAFDENGASVPLSSLEKAYAWTNEKHPNIVYGYTTYSR
ncbi:MAG: hypothetical protein E7182_04515 [Erysipelotrichaceae bacterium]|nr:hypothetical protein [Erysipelotrichaceae bacterium]